MPSEPPTTQPKKAAGTPREQHTLTPFPPPVVVGAHLGDITLERRTAGETMEGEPICERLALLAPTKLLPLLLLLLILLILARCWAAVAVGVIVLSGVSASSVGTSRAASPSSKSIVRSFGVTQTAICG